MKTVVVLLLTILVGCTYVEEPEIMNEVSDEIPSLAIDELIIPEGFDFESEQERVFEVTSLDNQNKVLANVPFSVVYLVGGQRTTVASMMTDVKGQASLSVKVPNHVDTVLFESHYVGVPNTMVLVDNDQGFVMLGGRRQTERRGRIRPASNNSAARVQASNFHYMGDYDNDGVPYYLEPVDDHIFQDLLDLINNTLPENAPVPTNNPQYLADNIEANTKLQEEADIWITFVHEGAGWRNALGYYTYDLNNPPASKEDIDSMKLIFPNASFKWQGGGLNSGNKIYLGKFPANTGIGWFLVPNGWNGTDVSDKSDIKFSNKDFNTFTGTDYRQHVVLLKDDVREIVLLGMEDISRPAGDNDFNDAVFYLTANPFTAIVTDNLESTQTSGSDQDGDGVSDANDAYPTDPEKAFDVFTPGEGVFGSLAFEDLWPSKGDYDMNDMVINYNYQFVANTSLQIKEIKAKFKLRALGATIHSGFGVELDIPASLIESITGYDVVESDEVVLNANGTEAGHDKAVLILFEDGFRVWSDVDHINTKEGQAYQEPVEFTVSIKLKELYPLSSVGYAPFNAFIFDANNRAKEIHLSTGTPTSKMAMEMLGSGEDKSTNTKYFVTSNDLPWAFSLPVEFEYPKEFLAINNVFLKFNEWAQSGGRQYDDWYMNNSGYREESKVYKR